MKIYKLIVSLFLAFSLTISATGCGSNASSVSAKTNDEVGFDNPDEFTIRIGVNSLDNNFLLKILDNHTGFLKDQGITLETTEFSAGINTIDAITTDTVDIGLFATYAGVNRIGNTLSDSKLRAFAMIDKSSNYKLYANPDTVAKPEDLVGHIGVSQAGVVFEYYYGELFNQYGIDPKDVTITNVGSVQEALALAANNGGDAYWTGSANYGKFEEKGWKPVIGIDDLGIYMYTFLVADESYLQAHQHEVAKYLQASEEGFKYIDENLDEFAEWVTADTGLDKEIFKAEWNSRRHYYSFEQEAYDDLVKIKNWCYENDRFDTNYKIEEYINTDALAEAFPDRVSWEATEK